MTPDLQDLLRSIFYIVYNLNIPPSEVEQLSTYEMREYISLLQKKLSDENESHNSFSKSLMSILGVKKKSKS